MEHRGYKLRPPGFFGWYLGIVLILFIPVRLDGQTNGKISLIPVNPNGSRPTPNLVRPIQYGGHGGAPDKDWSFNLATSYEFLNDRSRVGGLSLDTDSAVIDFTVARNSVPYTSFDFTYMYSHGSGSSPSGMTESGNQNVGSLRILQPLDWLWHDDRHVWLPVTLSHKPFNFQSAIILEGDYGSSFSSFHSPQLASLHASAYPFLGNALYDFQFAWFPSRADDLDYPNFLFEYTSGVQLATTRLHVSSQNSSTNSSGRQITYRNICSVTYSFPQRLGFLVAAEWDAPLDSEPLRGSQPYYANTAIFTAGLVYNFYPTKFSKAPHMLPSLSEPNPWSLSLLYSYTAFDPLTESNQLVFQASFSF
jgi:hypothetical protein